MEIPKTARNLGSRFLGIPCNPWESPAISVDAPRGGRHRAGERSRWEPPCRVVPFSMARRATARQSKAKSGVRPRNLTSAGDITQEIRRERCRPSWARSVFATEPCISCWAFSSCDPALLMHRALKPVSPPANRSRPLTRRTRVQAAASIANKRRICQEKMGFPLGTPKRSRRWQSAGIVWRRKPHNLCNLRADFSFFSAILAAR